MSNSFCRTDNWIRTNNVRSRWARERRWRDHSPYPCCQKRRPFPSFRCSRIYEGWKCTLWTRLHTCKQRWVGCCLFLYFIHLYYTM